MGSNKYFWKDKNILEKIEIVLVISWWVTMALIITHVAISS